MKIIGIKSQIHQLTEEKREIEHNIKNDKEIIKCLEKKFNILSDKSQIFNYGELRERTKLYFSISHQRIRDLESKIAIKNAIISKLIIKQRKNSW